ncbi:IS200/IS605 family element transposase accessory protein TnpB [Deinococcus saxicola]|uniref:RNA-guided endonuclease InsQ/TnpB family protein n=1 Tax=Deinococcus saxicola TaxID=249406 RepID=UPI0039EDF3FF
MKVTFTAKLKLRHSPEQKIALDAVTLAYRDALNHTSRVAFEQNKMSSAMKLQTLTYTGIRETFDLPSQMACNVPRQVAATNKGLWTKLKQHNDRQAQIITVKPKRRFRPFRGFDAPAKYVSRTLTYNFGRDFSWKKGQQVSVQTLEGRQVMAYEGYAAHLKHIEAGCKIGAAKLYYQRGKRQYYLLVSFEVDLPDPQPADHKTVVGVDVGQRYHAVVTDTRDRSLFFSGQAINQKKGCFEAVRKTLQRKGTRSATRRLIAFSGRERRFIADRNHSLAAQILNAYPEAVIGLENLKDIRERVGPHTRTKADKTAKVAGGSEQAKAEKRRKNNRRRSQWSFAELQTFIAYKAPFKGSMAVQVDAHYTSQQCVKCGHTSKQNRPGSGLLFVCEVCGFQVHADLLGARNIALRTLAVRQDWTATGALSVRPDVSDKEAKAARLLRYAELRWSPDTSP